MGVSLYLLIPQSPDPPGWLALTQIYMPFAWDWKDRVVHQTTQNPIPEGSIGGFRENDRFGNLKEDSYGESLRYVEAHALATVFETLEFSWAVSRASIGFLRSLPKDYPVVLYWN